MKICILLPDYSTANVDYQNYDPARDVSALLPQDEVHTVFLNKLTTYKQLKICSRKNFDVYVNLCEGYLEWEVPSIDVIHTLDLLNLPYTGPNARLYDPPKELMKYVAYCATVATPAFQIIKKIDEINNIDIPFPLFVKPAKAGDSLGIDEKSLVHHQLELEQQVATLLNEYDEVLIEEYIKGREFTVLVAASVDGKSCKAFTPVEFIFPDGNAYKTYALKTSELHPEANITVTDIALKHDLCTAAESIFTAFNGVGYARLDFRMNEAGKLFFLEINFTCSVFYKDGYEGSADYILKYDAIGQVGFLKHIIEEGIARHQRKQKSYQVKGNAIAGYGIYATRNIVVGEVIFKGEEKAQRIITKQYVDANWNEQQKDDFSRYAYPISKNVFILWDEDATEWAPQNHSCNANTKYVGLNVIASRDILKGQELTLDYALLLNDTAQAFECSCKEPNCRGSIKGTKDNSVENRLSNQND